MKLIKFVITGIEKSEIKKKKGKTKNTAGMHFPFDSTDDTMVVMRICTKIKF